VETTSETAAETAQTCRHCGSLAAAHAHFCPQCNKILDLGRHSDYFAFLGVARKLNFDDGDLDRRFRLLSRHFHPDYFHNGDARERRASLARSSYLNDAYRTLRQRASRIAYLLELERHLPLKSAVGRRAAASAALEDIPISLLEEVFDLNEELDAVRDERARGVPADEWKARLERARAPILAKQAQHEAELQDLTDRWDELTDRDESSAARRMVLDALRDRMLERNYLANLLAGVERELTEP
jgi:molecular chaperone HscB